MKTEVEQMLCILSGAGSDWPRKLVTDLRGVQRVEENCLLPPQRKNLGREIRLHANKELRRGRLYPVSLAEERILRKFFKTRLGAKRIRPSKSCLCLLYSLFQKPTAKNEFVWIVGS
jgi:hypothetical protein